jgi:hypothetical protein
MLGRMFANDFTRLAAKTHFRRDMVHSTKTLEALRVSMQACYNPVLHAFDFYCAGDGDYSMGLGEFLQVATR